MSKTCQFWHFLPNIDINGHLLNNMSDDTYFNVAKYLEITDNTRKQFIVLIHTGWIPCIIFKFGYKLWILLKLSFPWTLPSSSKKIHSGRVLRLILEYIMIIFCQNMFPDRLPLHGSILCGGTALFDTIFFLQNKFKGKYSLCTTQGDWSHHLWCLHDTF